MKTDAAAPGIVDRVREEMVDIDQHGGHQYQKYPCSNGAIEYAVGEGARNRQMKGQVNHLRSGGNLGYGVTVIVTVNLNDVLQEIS